MANTLANPTATIALIGAVVALVFCLVLLRVITRQTEALHRVIRVLINSRLVGVIGGERAERQLIGAADMAGLDVRPEDLPELPEEPMSGPGAS